MYDLITFTGKLMKKLWKSTIDPFIHTMEPKKDSMGHLGTHSDWKGLILSGQTKVVSPLVSNGPILSGRQKAPPPRG